MHTFEQKLIAASPALHRLAYDQKPTIADQNVRRAMFELTSDWPQDYAGWAFLIAKLTLPYACIALVLLVRQLVE